MRHLHSTIGGLVMAGSLVVSAAAAPVPLSYDTPNGESGLYTYFDDTYSGSGDKTTSDAPLSGGLGDLTDGLLATGHWYQTPGAYVGWASIAPVVSFNFGNTVAFSGATLYFDDQDGFGSVTRPTSVEFDTGSGFQAYTPTITVVGPLARYDFDLGGALTSTLATRINHDVGNTFVMLTEAAFSGEVVPEPATWAMLAAGLGLAGFASTRRCKRTSSPA